MRVQQYHSGFVHYIGNNDYVDCADFIVQSNKGQRNYGLFLRGGMQGLRAPCRAWLFPRYCPVTSKTRLTGEGPNESIGTSFVWFTPGLLQSHTPAGKIVRRRAI
ncbi:hypothetical protein LMG27177_05293 [Paraburkholderia fynbosensis]|uniref:Uncharacterized protein n=1 Tax=Paraburkholderia fynbosensis TaxID=1200993 RepID=A0A6J5GKJ3_9BURK|nr:hypothetical protein LMG27177_05293 [Paraburkholderia fynbosensis]